MAPLPSTSVHSRLAVAPPVGTRTDLIRPATRTRSRHWASPIGVVPAARAPQPARRRHAARRRAAAPARPGDSAASGGLGRQPPDELEGDDGGVDVGRLADRGGDAVGAAVVQQPAPAGGEAAPGQQDGQLGVAVAA